MQTIKILAVAAILTAAAGPAFAEDAMSSSMAPDAMMSSNAMGGGDAMGIMQGGEAMSFMPDGHMGKMMVTDQAMMANMMKMATPLDGCIVIMTGMDGKTYMVKPTSADEKAACEKMAM
jgi:hypothetical protein